MLSNDLVMKQTNNNGISINNVIHHISMRMHPIRLLMDLIWCISNDAIQDKVHPEEVAK